MIIRKEILSVINVKLLNLKGELIFPQGIIAIFPQVIVVMFV